MAKLKVRQKAKSARGRVASGDRRRQPDVGEDAVYKADPLDPRWALMPRAQVGGGIVRGDASQKRKANA